MDRAIRREELDAAASDVIQIIKTIPEFSRSRIAVIGGLCVWKYLPDGRTTEDVDFIMDLKGAPKSVKERLLRTHGSQFGETARNFFYKASGGQHIQIDITALAMSPYLPDAAEVLGDIPDGVVPYMSPTDLIIFKIISCGYRADKRKSFRDATDAEAMVELLKEGGQLRLTDQEKSLIKPGLEDLFQFSNKQKTWWIEHLGI